MEKKKKRKGISYEFFYKFKPVLKNKSILKIINCKIGDQTCPKCLIVSALEDTDKMNVQFKRIISFLVHFRISTVLFQALYLSLWKTFRISYVAALLILMLTS